MREQAPELVPVLLEGAVFEEELTVEILRPTMRADKVFKVRYRNKPHVLHLEFESGSDSDMALRLLTYHVGILWDHRLPIISIIIYLFRAAIAESPFQELSEDEELLKFPFRVLPLWKLDAEQYVREHIFSMYPLLPAMHGASAELLSQAIQELAEHHKHDESKLARQLVWLGILLRRADTVSPADKVRVEERLTMFERLWEEDPKIQKYLADKKAEGKVEGEVRGLQEAAIILIQMRFPSIADSAMRKVEQMSNASELKKLFKLIGNAPDETTALWIVNEYTS